jgi:hypothetical protein
LMLPGGVNVRGVSVSKATEPKDVSALPAW